MKIDKKKLPVLDQNLKFQIILSAAAMMHLTFMLIFSFTARFMMMTFNVFSVALYVAGAIDCIKKTIEKHSNFWIIATFSEIVLHATLCTVIMGLEVFFFLYLMVIIPVAGYSIFFYVDKKSFNKLTGAFTLVTILAIIFSFSFLNIWGSVYVIADMKQLSQDEICLLQIVNTAFSVLVLFGFTFLFYTENSSLIERLNKTNQKLEYIATHDELTGLHNRHSLWKFFDELLKSGDHYCVVMGDLDDFKKINDTYGHDCGDLVLRSVASIILDHTGDCDRSFRWGGEEMLLIMRGEKGECYKRVDEIKKQICGLDIKDEGRPVKVSMTFGFVDCLELEKQLAEEHEQNTGNMHISMDNVISLADEKLYIGKKSGKNVIVA